MFLKKYKKPNGRVYLALMQGYWENGKSKSRTVQSLGYLDELEKQYGDPIAHFEAVAAAANKEERAKTAPITLTIHPSQKIDKRITDRKNIGCAVPLAIYNDLGVEQTLRNIDRNLKIEFDLNAVMRLLVCERLLNPGSKLAAWNNKDGYFFKTDFTDDDMYRSLDIFADGKARIIGNMNRALERMGYREEYRLDVKRKTKHNTYYDVTNYYFEISDPDSLRAKGVSKEHRKNPIVQMGLLQDKNALPITYKLFPGNTNDCETMTPALNELKDTYDLGRIITVADKGLNTSANIAANIAKGDGFIFSQSIRGTKSTKALRNWVTSDEGYAENESGEFKAKSRQGTKVIHLRRQDTADGKAKDVEIETKEVAFWSRKYAERARHEREQTIKRARELVINPSAYSAATHFGAAKYVKGLEVDKDTGEISDTKRILSFDEQKLRDDEACDGFYCIITSETGMADEEIIDAYRGLWRIEESFKITKSCIEARPVHAWTEKHIEAHFLTCYVALTLIRLLQLKTGDKYSADMMLKELSQLTGALAEDNWWLFSHRSDCTDDLFAAVGVEHPAKWMTTSKAKGLLSKKKS